MVVDVVVTAVAVAVVVEVVVAVVIVVYWYGPTEDFPFKFIMALQYTK